MVVEEEPQTPDGLVLKELPPHLRYAFLGENNTKLIIISAELDDEMEGESLLMLKRKMRVFAWYIKDKKGVIPLICMDNIPMEDEANQQLSINED